jgi:hypothetical protein
MLAFAFVALGMTAPATAWDAHEISHFGNPVAIDEHHRHDDQGGQGSHGHSDEAPAQDEDDDGGHDHMPSLSAGLSAIPVTGPAAIFPALDGVSRPSFAAKAPVDLIEPPPARPPRSL